MPLSLKEFDYHLPKDLIAQTPAKPRDQSRLLQLSRFNGSIKHYHFNNLTDILSAGDVLVINDSRVFPARLLAKKKDTGGQVEVFLHKLIANSCWECLVGGKVKPGLELVFAKGLEAKLISSQGDGTYLVDFNWQRDKFWQIINQIGLTPLPPYIKTSGKQSLDRARYQTVYADLKQAGSVAAPTAGLHFTPRLLAKLKKQGVKIIAVTLHVGLGTFAAVKSEDITKHQMHSELACISSRSAKALAKAKKNKHRIIAVGTTSCRVLESYGQAIKQGRLSLGGAYQDWTDIFIYPGFHFQLTDALITNFHLPKSSLLMLVSALAGSQAIKQAYQVAIKERYRFYSYGDAMFIG